MKTDSIIGRAGAYRVILPVLIVVLILIGGVSNIFAFDGEQVADAPGGATSLKQSVGAPEGVASARILEQAFNRVADEVLPVVVEINTVAVIRQNIPRFESPWDLFFGRPDLGQQEFRRPGLGSGVIVRREGRTVYVLTNNHVIGDADEISIRLHDGREFEGSIVGMDPRTDLAMVSFDTEESIPVARLGDSDSLDIGDWVLAVGNPFGFESTVTVGIVSALRRTPEPGSHVAAFTDYIQTDAAINPGNSGGALVNLDGEVVGINTWIASQSGGSVGLGFAIPVNNAKRAINDFVEKGAVAYGWLGVTIGDLTGRTWADLARDLQVEGESGVLVSGVFVGSPADRYGILPGDYIISVEGTMIHDTQEFARIIGLRSKGSRIDIDLVRNGRPVSVSVVLGDRNEAREISSNIWPGFMVTPLNDEIRDHLDLGKHDSGVVVTSVAQDSVAAVVGVRPGDLITAIDGESVHYAREFYRNLDRAGKEIDLDLLRAGRQIGYRMVKE